MESLVKNLTSNVVKLSPVLLCHESLTAEDIAAGSESLFVKDNQVAIDKTIIIRKTVILKERSLVCLVQSEKVDQPISSKPNVNNLSQNENFSDEMEISSQTSFMELCSQESAEKMDACSQESVISKMDLASQENVFKNEDNVQLDGELSKKREARSGNGSDLKRKLAVSFSDDLLQEENAGLCEDLQDTFSTGLKNRTYHKEKNTKRFKK